MIRYAFLLMAACGPAPVEPSICETTCGLRYQGDYPSRAQHAAFTCAAIQLVEDRFLAAVPLVRDSRFGSREAVCKSVKGWDFWTHPEGCWTDQWGRRICGVTECWSGAFQVNGSSKPHHGAMAHELMHVVQRCSPRGLPDPGEDADHAGWLRSGIIDAINAITGPE